ncbi:unnamed protein product [Boreogadus saida]
MMQSRSEHDEETVTELTSDALKMFSWVKRKWCLFVSTTCSRSSDYVRGRWEPGRNLTAYSGANQAKRSPESQAKTTLGAAGRMRRKGRFSEATLRKGLDASEVCSIGAVPLPSNPGCC